MVRVYFILLLLLLNHSQLNAQDEITFRSGDVLKAKILEVGTGEIVYKKFENLSGPSYTVKKDQVFMIKYENGSKDLFGTDKANTETTTGNIPVSVTPAIIYFYRPSKIVGSSPEIIVGTLVPDEVIVKVHNGCWYRSEYFYTGQREFVTGIYAINEGKLNTNLESGKTYYIRCSIMKGLGLQSQLELVDEATGKKDMRTLKEQVKAK